MTWQIIKWSPFIFRRFQARPKWTNHVISSLNFITPKNGLSTNDIVVSLPPYNDDVDDDDDYDEELPQHDPWGQKKVGRDKP